MFLFKVEERFMITGQGVVLLPGLGDKKVNIGASIKIIRPNQSIIETTIKGIGLNKFRDILIGPELTKDDVPVGSEVWLLPHYSMPIAFTITKSKETFEKQLAYLAERGRNKSRIALKKYFILLVTLTAIYLSGYWLTATDDFITFKAVSMAMIALGWCAFPFCYLFFVYSNSSNKKRFRLFVDYATKELIKYSVEIDEEKVVLISGSITHNLPWTDFRYFGVNSETLYVFNEVEPMNSLYWDKSEMGSESFIALMELIKRKSLGKVF